MASIAFLGTGNMGAGMAECLIEAGHDLTVYNRTMKKTRPLAELGATAADTPQEAAKGADAVIAMVGDDEASKAVWLGDTGALAAEMAENAMTVECSTLSHDWVLELAATAGQKGFRYIDCPVTGIPVKAAAGDLTLLVGAEAGDMETARPLLQPFSSEIIHCGPVCAGTAYKLMVNLMGAVHGRRPPQTKYHFFGPTQAQGHALWAETRRQVGPADALRQRCPGRLSNAPG